MDAKTIENYSNVFVTKEHCGKCKTAIMEKQNKSDVRIARIETKLNIILGVLGAVGLEVSILLVQLLVF